MDIDREKVYEAESYDITNREKYEDLKKKYENFYEMNAGFSVPGNMVKLQQCANGYIINDEDEIEGYEDNGRIACLKKLLKKYEGDQVVDRKSTRLNSSH